MLNYEEIIAKAQSTFLNGKRGTFAIVRTPENNKLWYAAPGVQSEIPFLRLRFRDSIIDETSFSGIAIIRSNPQKDKVWFAFYDPDKKAPYIASSWDEFPDFSLTAVAAAPNIPDGCEEPITIQAVFSGTSSAVARVQNIDIARTTVLQAKHLEDLHGELKTYVVNDSVPHDQDNVGEFCNRDSGRFEEAGHDSF